MAGRGPAPKDPSKRLRRNADPIPARTIPLIRVDAPELPAGMEWHEMTLRWWDTWVDSPLSDDFTSTDWLYLTETALLVDDFWKGDRKVAAEIRQRQAKFGATPEDRARLRIFFADADAKEEKRPATSSQPKASSPGSYGGLALVDES